MSSASHPTPNLPDELEDALADLLLRGSADKDALLDGLIAEHPEHAPALKTRASKLRGAAQSGSDGPFDDFGSDATPPIETIGPYELIRVLGRGGMGTVHLARQSEPVQRKVAIKVIQGGSREMLARFELERQALAVMSHPSIAQVFDAGISTSGQPYFVMEYVAGEPLTDYCDGHRFTLEARIALFQQVCRGVQHAHRKGVLHRDLKPANILVADNEGKPAVKIIDFGLARALDERLGQDSVHTLHGQLLGTPEYMSPEQAAGDALGVDTRSDTYSLGVVLYELLCGELPMDTAELRSGSSADIQRRILEHEPSKPSTKVSTMSGPASTAQARCLTRSTLHRQLKGDLDWIVLRAMAREPERRYETPADLAHDLNRYLANEPVLAGPPTAGYRFKKFVRRNRGRVAAGSILLVAMIVAWIGTAVGLGRAQREQARAEGALRSVHEISRWFLVDFHDQIDDLPGTLEARRQLVAQSLRYLDELASQRGDDYELAFDIALGYQRVGMIQGWPNQPNLGDREGALVSFQEVLDLCDVIESERPGAFPVDVLRVDVQLRIVDVHAANLDVEEAQAALEQARPLLERVDDPGELRNFEFAVTCREALLIRRGGDAAAALVVYHQAEVMLLEQAEAEASDLQLTSIGSLYFGLASLYSDEFSEDPRWEPERALVYFAQALEAYESLASRHPNSAFSVQTVITTRQGMASIHRRLGKLELAAEEFQMNVEAVEATLRLDPRNSWALESLGFSGQGLARTLRDLQRYDEAADAFEKTLTASNMVREFRPDDPRELRRHATTLEMLGGVHAKRADVPALRSAYARALVIWEAVQASPLDQWERTAVADARGRLVGHLEQLGALAPLLEELRMLDQELSESTAESGQLEHALAVRVRIGTTLFELAQQDQDSAVAVTRFEESLSILREALYAPQLPASVSTGLPQTIAAVEELLRQRSN
jgi:serine/threonine protein kinase/tetratricopeptide (TPR) repeat protein